MTFITSKSYWGYTNLDHCDFLVGGIRGGARNFQSGGGVEIFLYGWN